MGQEYVPKRLSESLLHTHIWAPDQPRQEIAITLPDGSQRKGTSWETSPMDIAKQISPSFADRVVIAKVSHTLARHWTRTT